MYCWASPMTIDSLLSMNNNEMYEKMYEKKYGKEEYEKMKREMNSHRLLLEIRIVTSCLESHLAMTIKT